MPPKDPKDAEVEDEEVKINKWDSSAVKNALDDAVREIFTKKYQYIENHNLMDGRLVICGIAVGVAMFALLWDYLYPFPESRSILIFSVTTYFFMMGILTLYTSIKEKGIFAVCKQNDNMWEASSYLPKYDDKYNLIIKFKNGKTGAVREAKITKSVANFIDVDGVVVKENLETEVSKLHNSLQSDRKDK